MQGTLSTGANYARTPFRLKLFNCVLGIQPRNVMQTSPQHWTLPAVGLRGGASGLYCQNTANAYEISSFKIMSLSPTSSHVYVNYTSLFSQTQSQSQGGNKGISAFSAAASSYSQGQFQVRSASMQAFDVLDLSSEALDWSKPATTKPTMLQATFPKTL